MWRTLILLLLFDVALLQAQSGNRLELFPQGQNFIPLRANFEEPRMGVMVYASNLNLKVDIGNGVDIVKYSWDHNKSIVADLEFMAYALATSYSGYRLQIDAVDGFFGGGLIYSIGNFNNRTVIRFRFIHNSSHLVDGHYDQKNDVWINGKKPIPFTRDFGELMWAKEKSRDGVSLRYYGAFSIARLVRPAIIKRFAFSAGFEIADKNFTGKFLGQTTNLFLAFHSYLKGMPEYSPSFNLMSGIKVGEWCSKGALFYLSYFYGNNFFNEYYSEKISLFSFGFLVEYF